MVPKHNCVYDSKSDITKYKIGDTWTCPLCGKEYERIDEEKPGGFKAVLASKP